MTKAERAAWQREYRKRNADSYAQYTRDYYAQNKDRIQANKKKRETPHLKKCHQLRTHYGITYDDYLKMLAEQGGGCAICKGTSPGRKGVTHFSVDHCHATNRVRGLLCTSCNNGLGRFKDSPTFLENAIAYLKKEVC